MTVFVGETGKASQIVRDQLKSQPAHLSVVETRERRISNRASTHDFSEAQNRETERIITCMVHNLSDGGAMVESSTNLPSRFVLDTPNQSIRRLCRVVWNCGNLTGVEFV